MPSGRMGIFWAIAGIREAAVVEFGCMGHNLFNTNALRRAGIHEDTGARLYTTYIDESDIAMGDISRIAATIRQAIDFTHPKVVFLQPSAVPEVIGTDLYAIANLLAEDFPETKIVAVGRGSFAISQHSGVQEALVSLVKALPGDTEKSRGCAFNIIGSCPDLYRYGADAEEIIRLMRGAFGAECGCALSSDTSVTKIEQMGGACLNLVTRREGIPAAKFLEERFGAPWVYGRPYGIDGSSDWLRSVGEALAMEPDRSFLESERSLALTQIDFAREYLKDSAWEYPEDAVLDIGGHYDVVKGILRFATTELPLKKGTCWCDCPEMGDEDIPYFDEDRWAALVEDHKKGYLMFSGEALLWAGKNTSLQIANPDIGFRIHPYDPPFVGFRGAVHLVNLWINEYTLTH
jgi:nitrogenase molybdenum-iron protein alpha/beta subunit